MFDRIFSLIFFLSFPFRQEDQQGFASRLIALPDEVAGNQGSGIIILLKS